MFIVLINRAYSFLVLVICSVFEEAEDVRVLVDRRHSDRRRQSIPVSLERRKAARDRRRSSPMLDIVMGMDK